MVRQEKDYFFSLGGQTPNMLAKDFPEPQFWDLAPNRKHYKVYIKRDFKDVCKVIGHTLIENLSKMEEQQEDEKRQAKAEDNK